MIRTPISGRQTIATLAPSFLLSKVFNLSLVEPEVPLSLKPTNKKGLSQNGTALYHLSDDPLHSSLSSLDGLDQLRNNLEQVAGDTVISHLKDGSGSILVHSDDALGILHTSLVLDSAGNTQSNIG